MLVVLTYLFSIYYFAMASRLRVFRRKFLRQFDKLHAENVPGYEACPEYGYPDCGAGWFSKQLPYKDWVEIEEPKVIWLSGFHIPESYTTALIQTTCRARDWALDKSDMFTNVTKIYDPKEIKERLSAGTYV